jgi:hypothetical protein
MKLPNGSEAIVELTKLVDYCLCPTHPYGQHKSRVFRAALGLTQADATELRAALLAAAREEDAESKGASEYGWHFVIDFEMKRDDLQAVLRSYWIIRLGEMRPRLVTCFVR